ncbi:MAG TPA: hypothetical protein VM537_29140 [Anaerolineae bacterium]|nr:hypothetical protein [Anaerolineae bacterium]
MPLAESYAEKSKRLVTVAGGGGMPSAPPKFDPHARPEPRRYEAQPMAPAAPTRRRSPTRLAAAAAAAPVGVPAAPRRAPVPQHSPAQLQAYVASEQRRAQAEAEAMLHRQEAPPSRQSAQPSLQGMAALQSFAGGQPPPQEPVEDPPVHTSSTEVKPESLLSAWDLEVIEMADQLDPAELVMEGFIAVELEVLGQEFTASVKSFKQQDWSDIRRDVSEFRRGIEVFKDVPDPSSPGKTMQVTETILPFPDEVLEFMQLRQLAQGVLGVNGVPYPNDWGARAGALQQLASPAYDALLREYTKFLQAVGTLFPDKPMKEKMEELKARLGKAQAHR